MNIHSLARTTPSSRGLIAARRESGVSEAVVAAQVGVDRKTVRKWTRRRQQEGWPTRPVVTSSQQPHGPHPGMACRRGGASSPALHAGADRRGAWPIQVAGAAQPGVCGLAKLAALEPPVPDNRYERKRPGELLHVDTKKLGRFYEPGHRVTGDRRSNRRLGGAKGWEFLHIAIDDRTRLAYAELLPDETSATSADFLRRAAAFYRRHGIRIQRVMSDNGVSYKKAFAAAVTELGARHLRTRPYTPRTNGKAERFIQTLLRLWAYVRPYHSSDERAAALAPWMKWYNIQRPHGSLNGMSPLHTLRQLRRDNVVGDHI